MIHKSKLIRESNLFTSTVIMLCFFSIIGFLGCEKENTFPEMEDITQSQEFEDYLMTHIQFVNGIQPSNTEKVIIGQINGRDVYRYSHMAYDKGLFNRVVEARNNLIKKYPNYTTLSRVEKESVYYDRIQNSKVLNEIVSVKTSLGTFVRLKSEPTEADDAASDIEGQLSDKYSLETFNSYENAYDAARSHGDSTGVESGGFIFPDGSAIFFVSDSATTSSTTLPVWNNGASTTYHYHPGGTPTMSSQDSLSMDFMSTYGINTCVIVTSDSTYTYRF